MFLTRLPLSQFFGLKSKTNVLLFIILALVSLFDLVALYFFTEAITSQINGIYIVASVIAFFFFNMMVQIYSIRIFTRFAYNLVSNNFKELFTTVLMLSGFHRREDDFLSKFFTVEFFRICERVMLPFIVIVSKSLTAFIIFIFTIIKNPLIMFSFSLCLFLIYLLVYTYVRPKLFKTNKSIESSITGIAKAVDLLNFFKLESSIYNINTNIEKKYGRSQEQYVRASTELQFWSSVPRPVVEAMIFIGLTLVIISSSNLDFELLVAIGMGCVKIVTSAQTIYYSMSIIKGNSSALDTYIGLHSEVSDLYQSYSTQSLAKPKHLFDFSVFISSENSKKVSIEDVKIPIKAGEKIAITGQSGIGKSTILNSIASLENELDVVIKCEDKVFSPSLGITQKFFGYVPQKPEIFPGTLRENLTLFENACDEELNQLLQKFDLVDERDLPIELDMQLGHRGNRLSGGQGQRVCLIRALICKRPVLLLDEVTSALDAEVTEKVLKEICNKTDLTVLWVTHDPLVIETLDQSVEIIGRND